MRNTDFVPFVSFVVSTLCGLVSLRENHNPASAPPSKRRNSLASHRGGWSSDAADLDVQGLDPVRDLARGHTE
jgi:hypothetical protein